MKARTLWALALAALLAACGGGEEEPPAEEPTPKPPLNCQARPELCK